MNSTWTNRSVLMFAQGEDPVRKIQQHAQKLVLTALENGWDGPPYNPIRIAELFGVRVLATSDIADARTIKKDGRAVIEFNPNQARERVRFSIAHEVAHLIFSDVLDEPRHRGGTGSTSDEWQLEMLCNLAASEFVMPIGSLNLSEKLPPIETLMTERRKYDVSAEAYMIRLAKSSSAPIAVFCASPFKAADKSWRYRVDYFISSPTAPSPRLNSKILPVESAVYRCTAIGYTDVGIENWISGHPLRVEYVGIPSYTGVSMPRALGLVRFDEEDTGRPPIHFIHGNVLEPRGKGPRIVCQLVNDRASRWGGGVARRSARKYPDAERDYSDWIAATNPSERLGKVHFSDVGDEVLLASIVAQAGFGTSHSARIRYAALEIGLHLVASRALEENASVHMPRIGTGASGGDWVTVQDIIEDIFTRSGVMVTVYDLPPRREQLELF